MSAPLLEVPSTETFAVGRRLLNGFWNAVVPQVAAEFIRAYLETQG